MLQACAGCFSCWFWVTMHKSELLESLAKGTVVCCVVRTDCCWCSTSMLPNVSVCYLGVVYYGGQNVCYASWV